jgi:hypothetical protein
MLQTQSYNIQSGYESLGPHAVNVTMKRNITT